MGLPGSTDQAGSKVEVLHGGRLVFAFLDSHVRFPGSPIYGQIQEYSLNYIGIHRECSLDYIGIHKEDSLNFLGIHQEYSLNYIGIHNMI